MKKVLIGLGFCIVNLVGFSQIPPGYYDSAAGKTGEDLREALHLIIKGHTDISYSSIKDTYHEVTDKKSNGQVWDMYSDVPGGAPSYTFTFIAGDKCGNYAKEGDCYNREHSFPQSWFSSASPMQTDLFHVYPTDGYVNGRRASFPYGNVASATWTSSNGGKLGTSATAGYSGTVFEPLDEYKGDFARTYFYMVTRYKDIASTFTSDMLTGDNLSGWAIDLMLDWSENDPVSQKELDRNNAIYGIQVNRNPYIDDINYVESVWGTPDGKADLIGDFNFKYNNGLIQIENFNTDASELKIISIVGTQIALYSIEGGQESIKVDLESGVYIAIIGGIGKRFVVK